MTRPCSVLRTGNMDFVSFDRQALMRIMFNDLAKYKTSAVLSHCEETEAVSRFVFEGTDPVASDFYKEYRLSPIPVYRKGKGGAAA